MGMELKVLVPINDFYYENLDEIHFELCDRLVNLFDNIEYFSYWREGNESYYGKDEPKKLRDELLVWNVRLLHGLDKAYNHIETALKNANAKGNDRFNDLWEQNEFPYHCIGNLMDAAMDVSNVFYYGTHCLYVADGEYSVMLPEEVRRDAYEHPEKYALIYMVYH